MTNRQVKLLLGFILISFIVLAWAYGLVLPSFENLDEIEHFSAIRYVAETGALPVHDPALQERYHYRQEASQPPLYYILLGGLTRLLNLPTQDTNTYLVSNPFVACGPSDQPYNKHILYHNPGREAYPWNGALLTLHLLRALSPLLQVITILGVYAIARLILPQYPGVALLAAALAAFNPQFLLVASGVNNDNLVTPLATVGLYLALLTRQRGLSLPRSIGLGLLAGLAGLSKLTGLLLLVLIALLLLEAAWRTRIPHHASRFTHHVSRFTPPVRVLGHGALIGTVALAICGWWFWRNWQLYGDPTALEPMLELVGRRTSSTLPLNESGLMFRSFWGQLACAFFSDWLYIFFGSLTAVGLVGLLVGCRQRQERSALLFLALWLGIVFVGWLRWGSTTAATGGRLLFPAIASTSMLLAYGPLRLWPAAWRARVALAMVFLLATVALTTLLWELRPLFAPPRTYAAADAPPISHPLEATFGADIGLLGYDAAVSPATRPGHLDVTLYWQALASISQDYALTIQLTSPIPGDNTLRLNYNTWPGRGNYPTSAWPPGRVIADHYHLRLPASDAPTQAWQLLVAFYRMGSGGRFPVRIGAQEVGNGLILTTLRVPGRPPDCPGKAALAEPVHLGAMISLAGATVNPQFSSSQSTGSSPTPVGWLQVSLCWESLAPAPLDYTVFVHLYDANGTLLATGDGPPMNGAFPTRLWRPGDVIADTHRLPLPAGNEDYRIGVGLYDPISGARLQAVQAGQPLPDDTVFLKVLP